MAPRSRSPSSRCGSGSRLWPGIAHLRDFVLRDLPTAVLWWLQRNSYNMKEVSSIRENLEDLVDLVSADSTPEHWTQRLSSALAEALPCLEEQSRWSVNQQLGLLLKTYGGEDVADEFASHVL